MSSDIRDQLRKLGMVSDQQVKQADAPKSSRKTNRSKPKLDAGGRGRRDGQRGGQKKSQNRSAKRQIEIVWVSDELPPKQRVMELIAQNRRNVSAAAEDYFFADPTGAVRSVKITNRQKAPLASGDLAVVKPQQNRDPYVLIPGEVAAKVAEIAPERIVLWHRGSSDGGSNVGPVAGESVATVPSIEPDAGESA